MRISESHSESSWAYTFGTLQRISKAQPHNDNTISKSKTNTNNLASISRPETWIIKYPTRENTIWNHSSRLHSQFRKYTHHSILSDGLAYASSNSKEHVPCTNCLVNTAPTHSGPGSHTLAPAIFPLGSKTLQGGVYGDRLLGSRHRRSA